MKILFISHDASRTGAPIGLLAFMEWLKANHVCKMATVIRNRGPLEPAFAELCPTLQLAPKPPRNGLAKRIRRLLNNGSPFDADQLQRWCAEQQCDVIYSNTITNGRVLDALKGLRLPVITHVHELDFWIRNSGPDNLRLVRDHTARFIAASKSVKANLVAKWEIPSEKISVIYEHIRELPPLPTEQAKKAARRTYGIPEKTFVIGGCGAEHWRKGRDLIPQLLLTLRRLKPQVDFRFLWIGRSGTPDEEYQLEYDLRVAGVEHLFRSAGEVSNPVDIYAAFDVFALLSREDPFPLACLEAAAIGCPTVCFADAGGMPEFVEGACGFVPAYLDVETAAQNVVQLYTDEKLRREFGVQARNKVQTGHTVATTGPKLLAEVEQLLAVC